MLLLADFWSFSLSPKGVKIKGNHIKSEVVFFKVVSYKHIFIYQLSCKDNEHELFDKLCDEITWQHKPITFFPKTRYTWLSNNWWHFHVSEHGLQWQMYSLILHLVAQTAHLVENKKSRQQSGVSFIWINQLWNENDRVLRSFLSAICFCNLPSHSSKYWTLWRCASDNLIDKKNF